MILSKKDILNLIKKKKIKITNLKKSNIGSASIDLTLDNQFRIFKQNLTGLPTKINNHSDYTKITKKKTSSSIIIKPNQTILGITKEKITLPNNICGLLQGRSRFARMGLMIHISASFIQPGVSNKQVLEINNMSNRTLKLYAGTKICQIILIKTSGKEKYKGIFKTQNNL